MPGSEGGGGAGVLIARNAGLGRAGQGSSTCYLLGSGAALLSFTTFPTDEAQIERAEQRIKGLGGGALAAERAVVSPPRPGG